jgi:hypothetical protein
LYANWVRRIPEIANPPLIVVQVLASVWRGKMLESWYVIDDPGNMLCGMISCLLVKTSSPCTNHPCSPATRD